MAHFRTVNLKLFPAGFKEKIYKTVSGEIIPEFMIFTEAEENNLFEILSAETLRKLIQIFYKLLKCAVRTVGQGI